MNYTTFTDVFTESDATRDRLKSTVGGLDDKTVSIHPDSGGWNIAQLVEHISSVDEGSCKICAKLLSKARAGDMAGDGKVALSPEFLGHLAAIKDTKLVAPERVRPGGEQSVAESLAKLSENRERLGEIKSLFESLNTTDAKFPHP